MHLVERRFSCVVSETTSGCDDLAEAEAFLTGQMADIRKQAA